MTTAMPRAEQSAVPWQLQFGARPVSGQGTCFRVWAPLASRVEVKIGAPGPQRAPLERRGDGVFEATVAGVGAGADYLYVIDDDLERPDPVSRSQPHGVHGPSRVVDPSAFPWTDADWRGLALENYVFYELHVGTFTPEGTFDGVIRKIRHLREVGVTAVELMPVAEFPGGRNWGYDGVDFYAPQSTYGGPDGLKRLVDACHREGLAVVLDVVYNHVGPEGNYLPSYAPYFSSRYRTPWGDALNYDDADSDGVRRFFIDNALYWVTEFHIDALRLDAIHGIFDFGATHLLRELTESVHAQARALGRSSFVIAESDLNDVRVINPVAEGGYAVDAQWSDDFHHALHTVLTGTRRGYLSDFGTVDDLRKAITEGFVYDGRRSQHRRRRHGSSSRACPGRQFVIFTQNHDQVANGSGGDRLSTLVSFERQKLAAALLLCAPYLPLLFMGQEYGETAPFLYFTSHSDPVLADAVRRGRAQEFESFKWDRPFRDPQDERTFQQSMLDWTRAGQTAHRHVLDLYRDLLTLRRSHDSLGGCRKDLTAVEASEADRWLRIERGGEGSAVSCVFNLGDQMVGVPVRPGRPGRLILWTGAPRYGGPEDGPGPPAILDRSTLRVELRGATAALYASDPQAGDLEPEASYVEGG